MIVQDDVIPYIRDLLGIGKMFPFDKIGKVLADLTPKVFSSPNFNAYVMAHKNETHVIPDEKIDNFPPFWNKTRTPLVCSRRMAQNETIKDLKRQPTIYLSCDGGVFTPSDYTSDISMIRQSAVIQTPLWNDRVINVKSVTMPPDTSGIKNPSVIMTKGEICSMYCMINQITGGTPDCNGLGCSGVCPLKKINFEPYINAMKEKKCKIVGFLDRPICANYFRALGQEFMEVIPLYKKLLMLAKEKEVPLISVKQSSNHKALTRTIIDMLARGPMTQNSVLAGPIIEFIKENVNQFDFSRLDPTIRQRYNLSEPDDFIRFLNHYWKEGFLQNVLIDYSIYKHIIKGFEYRSNSFTLNDWFLMKNYPDIKFHFFYINYGDDWGRVEYVNCSPEEAARDYYIQTAMGKYYPLIIQIAHEKAVLGFNYQKMMKKVLQRTGLAHPTIKSRTKG